MAGFVQRAWRVNCVFRRDQPWNYTEVFDAMLETLVELAGRNTADDKINSTG